MSNPTLSGLGRPEVLAPEPMGDFVLELLEGFELDAPHVVAPDVATSAVVFAAAKQPELRDPAPRERRTR